MKFDLEKYYERISWKPDKEDALENLYTVHTKHLRAIAFESIDPYLKRRTSVAEDDVYEKLVLNGRGGYCFEMNCLLYQALRAMGYEVKPYLARISRGEFGYGGFSHRLNVVTLDGKRYITDVGYGGDGIIEPVLIEPGLVQKQPFNTYRVVLGETVDYSLQILQNGSFTDMIGFIDRPAVEEDFIISNHYTSTYPMSFFASFPICVIHTETGKITLMGERMTILENGVSTIETVSREKLPSVLKDVFKINIEGLDFSDNSGNP